MNFRFIVKSLLCLSFVLNIIMVTLHASDDQALSGAEANTSLTSMRYRLAGTGEALEFPFSKTGFSFGEPTHRWTDGEEAYIIIPLEHENQRIKEIAFNDVRGFISGSYSQTATVSLNDLLVKEYLFDIHSPSHTITVPIPNHLTSDSVKISFGLPNACLPGLLDPTNPDGRKVALMFNLVDVTFGNTADFSEQLQRAEGFGLPHTISIKLDLSESMLKLKSWVKEGALQFGTLNNMGSNVNDFNGEYRYGCTAVFYDFFKKNCGDFILDIGCGMGQSTKYFLQHATIVFNDICNDHLSFVYDGHHQSPGKGFYLNNKLFPHEVDFPSECCTGIMCSYLGHYLSPTDLELGFQKMADYLKPGGIIFYRVLSVESHPFLFHAQTYDEKAQNGEVWPGYIEDISLVKKTEIKGLPKKVHPHGIKEVRYLAQLSGLEIVEGYVKVTDYGEKYTPPGTFMAILRKPLEGC